MWGLFTRLGDDAENGACDMEQLRKAALVTFWGRNILQLLKGWKPMLGRAKIKSRHVHIHIYIYVYIYISACQICVQGSFGSNVIGVSWKYHTGNRPISIHIIDSGTKEDQWTPFLQTLSNHPPFTPSGDQYVVSLLKTLHAKTHPRRFQPTKPPVHNLHLYLCYPKTNKKCLAAFAEALLERRHAALGFQNEQVGPTRVISVIGPRLRDPNFPSKKWHLRSWSLAGKFLSSEVSRNFLDIFFLLILSDVKRDFGNGFDPASRWSLHLGCNDLWYGAPWWASSASHRESFF